MALFRHRHTASPPKASAEDSPFAPEARDRGWEAVDASVFPSDLTDYIHKSARVLRGGVPHAWGAPNQVDHPTVFHDVFRSHVGDRTVIVANGVTNLDRGFGGPSDIHDSSVCVVELPSVLSIACIEPRRLHPLMSVPKEVETGDAAFDKQFRVNASPELGEVTITPEMRQLIMSRDDWIFRTQLFLLACIADDRYESVDAMQRRIDAVLAIVAAIPESMLPRRVDHSVDDLAARISRIDDVEGAIAFLQQLTPADREQLAHSDTPLSAFADVTTPEQAMARFESLDGQRKMQLMAMFMRVDNDT